MSLLKTGLQSMQRRWPGANRAVGAALLASIALAAAGCQVRPLYGETGVNSAGVSTTVRSELAQISIKPMTTRYGQQVRNELIFLFSGGAGQTQAGRYAMNLIVTANHESGATVRVESDADLAPTAGMVTMMASYTVTDSQTGSVVANGTREITTSYDLPRQEFAAMRSQRDAENRGARELAQIVQLAVAQQMSRGK